MVRGGFSEEVSFCGAVRDGSRGELEAEHPPGGHGANAKTLRQECLGLVQDPRKHRGGGEEGEEDEDHSGPVTHGEESCLQWMGVLGGLGTGRDVM